MIHRKKDNRSSGTVTGSRIFAIFTALTMMLACAIPSVLPKTAYAAGYNPDIKDNGAIQLPTTTQLGDLSTASNVDDGVATYVGGNMYVGHKVDNITTASGPMGSYAVEAEGLTVVNGKVMLHPLKNSWKGKGFRFGVVGFGSQLRPAAGESILRVGNNTQAIPTGMNSALQAWGKQGWFGSASPECRPDASAQANSVKCNYNAQINGASTDMWGSKSPSLVVQDSDGSISWSNANAMGGYEDFKTEYADKLSSKAQNFERTGTATFIYPNSADYTSYQVSEYTRKKYDYDNSNGTHTYEFAFDVNKTINKEAILEFTGTNNDALEVFTIDAADLNALSSNGYTGLSYAFKNIQDTASIVINVDTSKTNGVVDFHNGWRIYQNSKDISDGYMIGSPNSDAYAKLATRTIWNFYGASDVTIRGGYADGNMSSKNFKANGNAWEKAPLRATDDPAAALVGTVIVPKGRFESHVSTNGRVWVSGDFEMYNDQLAVNPNNNQPFVTLANTNTTSVIDMDQERHNFRASLMTIEGVSRIGWQKITPDATALGGTTWGIYKTVADAVANNGAGQNPIYTVKDNGNGDWDATAGTFQIHNLAPNANYYIKEVTPAEGYQKNPYTYLIQAGPSQVDPYTDIVKAYDASGTEVGLDQAMLNQNKIINNPTGADIAWGKKDENGDFTTLPGSQWKLYNGDSTDDKNLIEIVTDLVATIKDVEILQNGSVITNTRDNPIEIMVGQYVQLSSRVNAKEDGQNVPQQVTWTSNNSAVEVYNGIVRVLSETSNEPVLITATSNADPTKSASVWVMPKPQQLTSLEITQDGQVVGNRDISLNVNDTLQLGTITNPVGDFAINWSSDNPNVVSVDNTGKITAKSVGRAQISVNFGGQQDTITVIVTSPNYTTVYFNRSGWASAAGQDLYLYYGDPNSTTWHNKQMTQYCGDWWYATVDDRDFAFLIARDGVFNNDAYLYKATGGKNFYADSKAEADRNEFMVYGGQAVAGVPSCDPDPGTSTNQLTNARMVKSVFKVVNALSLNADQLNGADTSAETVSEAINSEDAITLASEESVSDEPQTQDDAVPYPDMDPAAGKFRLEGLPDGTYTLMEYKSPDGYLINPQAYKITIANKQVTWTPQLTINPTDNTLWIGDTKTQVNWNKVDAGTKQKLNGSEWKLQVFVPGTNGNAGAYQNLAGYENITDCDTGQGGSCDGKVDRDPMPGQFQMNGLNTGYYRLVETKAPEGYKGTGLDQVYWYFSLIHANPTSGLTKGTATSFDTSTGAFTESEGSVQNGSQDSRSGVGAANVLDIPNERRTGTVHWVKVSSTDVYLGSTDSDARPTPLAGSEWQLTFASYDKKDGNPADIVCQLTDTSSSCTQNGTAIETPTWAQQVDSQHTPGEFSYGHLPWGNYTLMETKAPDGYYLDTTVRSFVIGPETTGGTNFAMNYTIQNTPGVVLPATGGRGNNLITLVGFALTAIMMLGLGVTMRRRSI